MKCLIGGKAVTLTDFTFTKKADYEEVPKEFEFIETAGIPLPVPKNRWDTELVKTEEFVEGELSGKGRMPDAIGRDIVDLELPEEEITIIDTYFGRVRAGADGWSVKFYARGIRTPSQE